MNKYFKNIMKGGARADITAIGAMPWPGMRGRHSTFRVLRDGRLSYHARNAAAFAPGARVLDRIRAMPYECDHETVWVGSLPVFDVRQYAAYDFEIDDCVCFYKRRMHLPGFGLVQETTDVGAQHSLRAATARMIDELSLYAPMLTQDQIDGVLRTIPRDLFRIARTLPAILCEFESTGNAERAAVMHAAELPRVRDIDQTLVALIDTYHNLVLAEGAGCGLDVVLGITTLVRKDGEAFPILPGEPKWHSIQGKPKC